MNYLDMILEDADALLESSNNKNNQNNQNNKNKPPKQKFWEQFRNGTSGIYGPVFSKTAVDLTKSNVLKPYGFKEIDITNKRQLTVVLASIKRRRDIQAAKALYVGVVGSGVSIISEMLSRGANMISDNPNVAGPDTITSNIFGGAGTILHIISATAIAFTAFMEIANAIDVVKATKEIKETRNNIMDAYDRVSYMINNGKAAGADPKAYDSYKELLSFRDSLRNAQMTLTNFGGLGAGQYNNKLVGRDHANNLSDQDRNEMATMGYAFYNNMYDKNNKNGGKNNTGNNKPKNNGGDGFNYYSSVNSNDSQDMWDNKSQGGNGGKTNKGGKTDKGGKGNSGNHNN